MELPLNLERKLDYVSSVANYVSSLSLLYELKTLQCRATWYKIMLEIIFGIHLLETLCHSNLILQRGDLSTVTMDNFLLSSSKCRVILENVQVKVIFRK